MDTVEPDVKTDGLLNNCDADWQYIFKILNIYMFSEIYIFWSDMQQ